MLVTARAIDGHLTRRACLQWFEARYSGRPLVKSACVGCPTHSAREWVEVRKNDPEMWERTVALDASLRDLGKRNPKAGITSGQIFLHNRCSKRPWTSTRRCWPAARACSTPETAGERVRRPLRGVKPVRARED